MISTGSLHSPAGWSSSMPPIPGYHPLSSWALPAPSFSVCFTFLSSLCLSPLRGSSSPPHSLFLPPRLQRQPDTDCVTVPPSGSASHFPAEETGTDRKRGQTTGGVLRQRVPETVNKDAANTNTACNDAPSTRLKKLSSHKRSRPDYLKKLPAHWLLWATPCFLCGACYD